MIENSETDLFSDVEETGILTLYCKAIESQTEDPILYDEKAIEIAGKFDPYLAASGSKLLQRIAARKLDPRVVGHIALRADKNDQYTREFLRRNPDDLVVNIGCGLDPRFFRIDNGKLRFFDLDLPEVIQLKNFLAESKRYQMIAGSALERE
jgi:O-methyltransferase involved in polyketide biosynthesis